MTEKKTIISEKALLPVSLVLVIAGAAVGWGLMKGGDEAMKDDITEIKQNMVYLNEKVDRLIERNLMSPKDVSFILESSQ